MVVHFRNYDGFTADYDIVFTGVFLNVKISGLLIRSTNIPLFHIFQALAASRIGCIYPFPFPFNIALLETECNLFIPSSSRYLHPRPHHCRIMHLTHSRLPAHSISNPYAIRKVQVVLFACNVLIRGLQQTFRSLMDP